MIQACCNLGAKVSKGPEIWMANSFEIWDVPETAEVFAVAGWEQWANAGSVSSDLPQYLVDHLEARRIGRLLDKGNYLFQLPGTHDLMRPQIEFDDGFASKVQRPYNDIYFVGEGDRGLVIFQGTEPHIDVDRYSQAFFDAMHHMRVSRVVGLGGVYGAMPFRRDRMVSCSFSLPRMRQELDTYAVSYSNYKGGASLGSYLSATAFEREVEYCNFYSMVPAYDFSQLNLSEQGMRVEFDFRAWHELMRRVNAMFKLRIDLSDLEEKSFKLTQSLTDKVEQLSAKSGHERLARYFDRLDEEFEENSFLPYEQVWKSELGQILDDLESDDPPEPTP